MDRWYSLRFRREDEPELVAFLDEVQARFSPDCPIIDMYAWSRYASVQIDLPVEQVVLRLTQLQDQGLLYRFEVTNTAWERRTAKATFRLQSDLF